MHIEHTIVSIERKKHIARKAELTKNLVDLAYNPNLYLSATIIKDLNLVILMKKV